MSKNPFNKARNPDWQNMRLEEWTEELRERSHTEQAAEAAQAQANAAGEPVTTTLITREWRGRLGGAGFATVGAWQEIARFECFESYPMTIQSAMSTFLVSQQQPAPPNLPPIPLRYVSPWYVPLNVLASYTAPDGLVTNFARVMLRVRVGAGNAQGGTTFAEYLVVAGSPFSVTGTKIFIDAQVFPDETAGNMSQYFSNPQNTQLDPSTVCFVNISIALGKPANDIATKWLVPGEGGNVLGVSNSSQQLFLGPGRVKQMHGYNANGTTSSAILYLYVFDIVGIGGGIDPTHNTIPMFVIPMQGGGSPFSWDCIASSRSFTQGLGVSLSSNPDGFAVVGAPPGGVVRVDTELFASGMQVSGSQPNA